MATARDPAELLAAPVWSSSDRGCERGRWRSIRPHSSTYWGIWRSFEPTTTSRGHNSGMRSLKPPLFALLGAFAACGCVAGAAAAGGSPSHPVQVRVVLAQHRAVAGYPI